MIDGGVTPGDAIGGLFAATGNGHADVVRIGLKKLEVPPQQLNAILAMALKAGK